MKDFFETELDYGNYDHKVSFDIIDKLYDMSLEYKRILEMYNKYQKQIADLSTNEKDKIANDPNFEDVKKKLDHIDKFTRFNAFDA